jgi:hypothetical protein
LKTAPSGGRVRVPQLSGARSARGSPMNVVQIESLVSPLTEDELAALAEADVIVGVDVFTLREFTVFGLPSLESTTSLKKPTAMRTVRVTVNCQSGELEQLLALVRVVKGRDDYEDTDE